MGPKSQSIFSTADITGVNTPIPASPAVEPHAHVLRLARFIQRHACADALTDLLARCRSGADGLPVHRGDDAHVLLELCFTWNPVDLLGELFTGAQLRRVAGAEAGVEIPTGAPIAESCHRVLTRLGFPATEPQQSLEMVRQHVRDAQGRIPGGDPVSWGQDVTAVARQLERVCDVLGRFLCQTVLGLGWSEWLIADAVPQAQSWRTASLGTRLGYLHRLEGALRARAPHDALACRIAEHGLLPALPDLVRLRNDFSHDRPYTPDRVDAIRFFAEAARLLDHLAAIDAFPRIVTVDSVTVDSLGRCKVSVVTPEGTSQSMFTDVALLPGQVWFVQPLSNPVWVYPRIVASTNP